MIINMYDFKEVEERILKLWQNKQIYTKLKKRNSKGYFEQNYFIQEDTSWCQKNLFKMFYSDL